MAGEDRPRLSLLRVCGALVLVTGLGFTGYRLVDHRLNAAPTPRLAQPWFAPYVDTTLTPIYPFQDASSNPAKDVVLSFVVADPSGACTPSWGGAFTLAQAGAGLDLDRRLARLRQQHRDAIVSFGGRDNTELGVSCTDAGQLATAYQSVIDRYQLTTVDFDLENTALGDVAVATRRAEALRQLQRHARANGRRLAIWFTLPVGPDGLPTEAIQTVDHALAAGVDLAGVNVMTMDFGTARDPAQSMGATAVKALDATTSQLDALYRRHGVDWSDAALSNHLGVTPMLGNNDVAGERFDTADARQVLDYVRSHGLQRVSYWSLNRDTACGPNNPGRLSNVCSGVAEKPQEFAGIFGVLHGTAAAAAGVRATPHVASVPADNPNTAPYPIWQTARVYVKGDKVVWRGSVYQAKWYSQGDVPDAPVQHDWNTPWRLVGPVLPTDRPVPTTTLPAGTYPDWSSGVAYQKGARVLYRGVGYEAKWYTVGDAPDPSPVDPYSAPWSRIGSG